MKATPPEIVLAGLDALPATGKAIARTIGVSEPTVSRLLAKYQPVADTLRNLKRDHFVGGWQHTYLLAYDQLVEAAGMSATTLKEQRDRASIQRDLAVTMGIATERVLLMTGQPTQIVGHLHEVRITLPDLAAKLAAVGQAISSTPPPVVVEAERT